MNEWTDNYHVHSPLFSWREAFISGYTLDVLCYRTLHIPGEKFRMTKFLFHSLADSFVFVWYVYSCWSMWIILYFPFSSSLLCIIKLFLFQKASLAIRIMILTFTMENLLKQSPNGLLSQLPHRQVNEYLALEREKSEKTERLRDVMLNDRDIAMG